MEEAQILKKSSRRLFVVACVLGVIAIAVGTLAITAQRFSDGIATMFLIAAAVMVFVEHRVTELKAEMLSRFDPAKTSTSEQVK